MEQKAFYSESCIKRAKLLKSHLIDLIVRIALESPNNIFMSKDLSAFLPKLESADKCNEIRMGLENAIVYFSKPYDLTKKIIIMLTPVQHDNYKKNIELGNIVPIPTKGVEFEFISDYMSAMYSKDRSEPTVHRAQMVNAKARTNKKHERHGTNTELVNAQLQRNKEIAEKNTQRCITETKKKRLVNIDHIEINSQTLLNRIAPLLIKYNNMVNQFKNMQKEGDEEDDDAWLTFQVTTNLLKQTSILDSEYDQISKKIWEIGDRLLTLFNMIKSKTIDYDGVLDELSKINILISRGFMTQFNAKNSNQTEVYATINPLAIDISDILVYSIKEDSIKADSIKEDLIKEDLIKEDSIKVDLIKEDLIKVDLIKEDLIEKDTAILSCYSNADLKKLTERQKPSKSKKSKKSKNNIKAATIEQVVLKIQER